MQKEWTRKDQQSYRSVRTFRSENEEEPGRSDAAPRRRVRAPRPRTQGTGDPNRPLEERTRDELYNLARERGIAKRSEMSKAELLRALQA